MAKIIIYDNKNLLIGKLERTEKNGNSTEHIAVFSKYKIFKSVSFKKQIKKIEKIIKYHKEISK